jgi:hypothetical protein
LDSLLTGSKPANLALDDFDILEIPTEVKPRAVVQPAPAPAASVAQEPASAPTVQYFDTAAAPQPPAPQSAPPASTPALTRGDIEAIAATLSQKLSEDVIREIAMKIVPEVTAKIIEKMVEQATARR